jgi:2-polyprenyl-6-methoxyphenol hydroxylase-like FAD-dependent oxidoreductase
MTRVAIVGAGQAGATLALALAENGVDVKLFSDRPVSELRDNVPATGQATIFSKALEAERELGMYDYVDVAPSATGSSTTVVGDSGIELVATDAHYADIGIEAVSVDTRLKTTDRIGRFIEKGGDFIVQPVDLNSLDGIAEESDLTLVATGKGGLSGVFAPDPERSPYAEPQRDVLMLTVEGLGHGPDVFAHHSPYGGSHNVLSIVSGQGEVWWGPYLHKDAGATWSVLVLGHRGGDWSRRLAGISNASDAMRVVRELHRDYLPWDLPEIEAMEVIEDDPFSWLKGAVTPVVRFPVGRTPAGQPVAALGDTSMALDPSGAQGAQAGLIQAAMLAQRIVAWEGPFDATWIQDSFDVFYARRGRAANRLIQLVLRDPRMATVRAALDQVLVGDPRVATWFIGLLSDPTPLLGLRDAKDVETLISELTDEPFSDVAARAAAQFIAGEGVRQTGEPVFPRSRYGASKVVG